jgi:predicted RNA-binding protein
MVVSGDVLGSNNGSSRLLDIFLVVEEVKEEGTRIYKMKEGMDHE